MSELYPEVIQGWVSQENIDNADWQSIDKCGIALALKDFYSLKNINPAIDVRFNRFYIYNHKYIINTVASKIITKACNGFMHRPEKPFWFRAVRET